MHSAELSQQILDWYTPSHIIHGMIFYGLLHLILPRTPVLTRLAIAVGIEVAWEIAENSPLVIEEYRKQATAAGPGCCPGRSAWPWRLLPKSRPACWSMTI
jgi:hypothetical protein